MPYIQTINGIEIPAPEMGSGGISLSTFVDDARSSTGHFMGQPIGDDKIKIDINIAFLSSERFSELLKLFDRRVGGKFVNTYVIWDPVLNTFRNTAMYVSDRSGTPVQADKYGRPILWRGIKLSLIEV